MSIGWLREMENKIKVATSLKFTKGKSLFPKDRHSLINILWAA